jgi:hypothetical protein
MNTRSESGTSASECVRFLPDAERFRDAAPLRAASLEMEGSCLRIIIHRRNGMEIGRITAKCAQACDHASERANDAKCEPEAATH